MITDVRVSAFINSLDCGNTEFLNGVEDMCRETDVPVIRPQVQGLLKFLLALHRPKTILEVGTAIGFSALLMSEYAPEGCHTISFSWMRQKGSISISFRMYCGCCGRGDCWCRTMCCRTATSWSPVLR